jgi:hypothetical protein
MTGSHEFPRVSEWKMSENTKTCLRQERGALQAHEGDRGTFEPWKLVLTRPPSSQTTPRQYLHNAYTLVAG